MDNHVYSTLPERTSDASERLSVKLLHAFTACIESRDAQTLRDVIIKKSEACGHPLHSTRAAAADAVKHLASLLGTLSVL